MAQSAGIWIVFISSLLVALGINIWQSGFGDGIRLRCTRQDVWQGLGLVAGIGILAAGAAVGQFTVLSVAPYALGGALLPWLLGLTGLNAPAKGVLLLGSVVGLTVYLMLAKTATSADNLSDIWTAIGFGLVLWKTTALIWNAKPINHNWLDVLPALCFLVGQNWIKTIVSASQVDGMTGILLGSLAQVLFLRSIYSVLPFKLSWLKALFIVLLGGLAMLGLVSSILVAPKLLWWAAVFAGGLLLASVFSALQPAFQADDVDTDNQGLALPQTIVTLALLGAATLAASRLFGTMGWVVLAITMLIAASPRVVTVMALFWLSRVLLQLFIHQTDVTLEMSGPYANATLYGSIVIALLLPAFLRHFGQPWLKTGVVIGSSIGFMLIATYFFQSDPVASFLLGTTVATLGITLLSPLYTQPTTQTDAPYPQVPMLWNILPAYPLLMISTASLATELAELGMTATRQDKLIVLLIVAGVLAALWAVSALWVSRRRQAV